MRLAALAIALAAALPASSQDEVPMPTGYVKLDGVGKIAVYAPDKKSMGPASKTELMVGVREIYAAYVERYGLDHESLRVGIEGSHFQERTRQQVALVLFPDEAEYDTWLLKSGESGDAFHSGKYFNTVGFALQDGSVGKYRWHLLWHAFSHVFIHHFLYFDAPRWLDEGLAIYDSFQNKRVVPGETPDYAAMLERLRKLREQKALTGVADLMALDGRAFDRPACDQAWVLASLLSTASHAAIPDILKTLHNLEACAFDKEEAIVRDEVDMAKFEVLAYWGGVKRLQASWDEHLDDLLDNPKHPPRPGPGGSGIAGLIPFMSLKFASTPPAADKITIPPYTVINGSIDFAPPWPGPVRVLAAAGDGKGSFRKEVEIYSSRSNKDGTAIKLDSLRCEVDNKSRVVKVTVEWQPEGHGCYRLERIEKK